MSDNLKTDNTEELSQLGENSSYKRYDNPSIEILETFPNQFPHRDYVTEFNFYEFTSLCPKTAQPDFATINIRYIPNQKCIETKSLKLYFLAYRQHGSFMETIVNNILEHCVQACDPRYMLVTGVFNPRGATDIKITAEFAHPSFGFGAADVAKMMEEES